MLRLTSHLACLIAVLSVLFPTDSTAESEKLGTPISKEAYEALKRSQEAVDRSDMQEALEAHKEAFLYIVESAEQFAASGETDSAMKLYRMVIDGDPHSFNHDRYGACHSLTSSFPVDRTNVFDELFWHCPEDILADWVGGIEKLDQLEPKLIGQLDIEFGLYHGESDLVAIAQFDVNHAGDVVNLSIDCQNETFSNAVRVALENARYVPAEFEGEPISRPGMGQAFVSKPAN